MGTKSFEPRIARAAPAFRIVGVVLLVSGLVHLYLDRVVFTPRPFAARAALCLGGTALEFVADGQLRRFRLARPAPEAILESGLWAWSRHPNYLGEILFWIGLAVFGWAGSGLVWWGWLGALAVVLLFRFASLPMIERRMLARRPGYAERQRRVALLVPRPPR